MGEGDYGIWVKKAKTTVTHNNSVIQGLLQNIRLFNAKYNIWFSWEFSVNSCKFTHTKMEHSNSHKLFKGFTHAVHSARNWLNSLKGIVLSIHAPSCVSKPVWMSNTKYNILTAFPKQF